MDKKDPLRTYCAYCGEYMPEELSEQEQLVFVAKHIWNCKKHPLAHVMLVIDLYSTKARNAGKYDEYWEGLISSLREVKAAFIKVSEGDNNGESSGKSE